jgi:uncharacterized protein YceK
MIIPSAGCGSIQTLNPAYDHVEIAHQGKKSYCKAIPRVFSGTAFNVCKLYGEPSYEPNLGSTVNGIPLFIIDTPLSLGLDTLVLPYTAIRQHKDGSISVN